MIPGMVYTKQCRDRFRDYSIQGCEISAHLDFPETCVLKSACRKTFLVARETYLVWDELPMVFSREIRDTNDEIRTGR